MKTHTETVSYQAIAQEIVNLAPLFGEERWEDAACRMNGLVARLEELPAACHEDRTEIECALAGLTELIEHIRQLFGGMAERPLLQ